MIQCFSVVLMEHSCGFILNFIWALFESCPPRPSRLRGGRARLRPKLNSPKLLWDFYLWRNSLSPLFRLWTPDRSESYWIKIVRCERMTGITVSPGQVWFGRSCKRNSATSKFYEGNVVCTGLMRVARVVQLHIQEYDCLVHVAFPFLSSKCLSFHLI